jgi:hypothetical protein
MWRYLLVAFGSLAVAVPSWAAVPLGAVWDRTRVGESRTRLVDPVTGTVRGVLRFSGEGAKFLSEWRVVAQLTDGRLVVPTEGRWILVDSTTGETVGDVGVPARCRPLVDETGRRAMCWSPRGRLYRVDIGPGGARSVPVAGWPRFTYRDLGLGDIAWTRGGTLVTAEIAHQHVTVRLIDPTGRRPRVQRTVTFRPRPRRCNPYKVAVTPMRVQVLVTTLCEPGRFGAGYALTLNGAGLDVVHLRRGTRRHVGLISSYIPLGQEVEDAISTLRPFVARDDDRTALVMAAGGTVSAVDLRNGRVRRLMRAPMPGFRQPWLQRSLFDVAAFRHAGRLLISSLVWYESEQVLTTVDPLRRKVVVQRRFNIDSVGGTDGTFLTRGPRPR